MAVYLRILRQREPHASIVERFSVANPSTFLNSLDILNYINIYMERVRGERERERERMCVCVCMRKI